MPETTPSLPTAAVADAAVRLGLAVRALPPSIRPLETGQLFSGQAMPVTHLGSVDVILETIDDSAASSVLVVDNAGRLDEACVGDLITLEAKLAGLSGLIIWGLHRDTAQLRQIGLPVHSRGAYPYGPRRVPPAGQRMSSAFIDGVAVSQADFVVADDDGVLIVGPENREELFALATGILATETAQADQMREGTNLRTQLSFIEYRRKQAADPTMTLRKHLQDTASAVET